MVRRITRSESLPIAEGDGSTAALRQLQAPDPDRVGLGEGGAAEGLRFTQAMAAELRWVDPHAFDPSGFAINDDGDWQALCNPQVQPPGEKLLSLQDASALTPEAITGYWQHPEPEKIFTAGQLRWLARPPFALLLVFLQLMRHYNQLLQAIPARHLDHYYQKRLGFQPQPAQANRVTVAFDLASEAKPLLLPAGTLLSAGVDSEGRDIHYSTADDLCVNHARLCELRALHIEREVTTLQALREREASASVALDAMLSLAYGDPGPGDALPPLLFEGLPAQAVDSPWLLELIPLLRFFWSSLKLEIQEFQQLICLHQRLCAESEAEWLVIFGNLGLQRLPASEQQLLLGRRDFAAWFSASVLGRTGELMDWNAVGIPGLDSVDDLYLQSHEPDLAFYLQELLDSASCLIPGDGFEQKKLLFDDAMVIKLRLDQLGRQLTYLLQCCGQRQRNLPTWTLQQQVSSPGALDFDANFRAALNGLSLPALVHQELPRWAAGLPADTPDATLAALLRLDHILTGLEEWFAMPADRLLQLASLAQQVLPTSEGEQQDSASATEVWWTIDRILESANRERQRRRHEAQLVTRSTLCPPGPMGVQMFQALVTEVLRVDPETSTATRTTNPMPWETSREQLSPWLASGQLQLLDQFHAQLLHPVIAPSASSWQHVQDLLVGVRTRIEGWQPLPMGRQEWRCLHWRQQPIEQGDLAAANPLQPCFLIPPADPAAAPEPGPGFAVASRLLSLAEGRRTIELTLALEPDGFSVEGVLGRLRQPPVRLMQATQCAGEPPCSPDQMGWGLNHALIAELSTASGWHALPIAAARLAAAVPPEDRGSFWRLIQQPVPKQATSWGVLQLTLTLDGAAPPLAPMEPALRPQLRLRLRPWLDPQTSRWRTTDPFAGLRLAAVHLKVVVEGIRSLKLQQEGSPLDPLEPFAPFGSSPTVGSNFYLSHPELLDPDLDSLSLQGRWCKLPVSLDRHYSAYSGWPGLRPTAKVSSANFQVEVTLLERHGKPVLPARQVPLFDAQDPGLLKLALPCGKPSLPLQSGACAGGEEDLRLQSRVWRLRLTPVDFGHGLYPALAASKAQELALAINAQAAGQALAMADAISRTGGSIAERYQASLQALSPASINPADYSVSDPYTPLLSELEASYSRGQMLLPGGNEDGEGLLHLHPLGEEAISAEASTVLPVFPHPGELLLALEACHPPQPLALAFQLVEGSARGIRQEPPLRWQVRDGAAWRPLEVLQDGTNGLLHSGIVRFELPAVAAAIGLPEHRVWLRILLLGPVQGYATILAVRTQAVEAVGLPAEPGAPPAFAPLAPGSIRELVEPVQAITAVHQPFSSRGGMPPETLAALRLRVAETLRHKGRALAPWDYERLLWGAFGSQLHKLVCRPGLEAGTVVVLVIPNLREQVPRNLLAPGASNDLLDAMTAFLRSRCPPEVTVQVRNPAYVHVQARLWVCLQEGVDPCYAEQQLQLALTQALSPWCFDAGAEVNLGGSLQLSQVVAAIDPLPFVDHVVKVNLVLVDAAGQPFLHGQTMLYGGASGRRPTSLAAPSADAVLIAYSQHEILFVPRGADAEAEEQGIGKMKIHFDLQVN